MFISALLVGTVLLFILVYYFGRKSAAYWWKRHVIFHPNNKVVGPLWNLVFGDRPFFEILAEIHETHPDAPCVGVGNISNPTLLVRDIKNIQHITQVDFESFHHRGMNALPDDILANCIPFLNGKEWKLIRKNMTPLFTAVKLRQMFTTMNKGALDFVEYLKDNPKKLKGDALNTLSTFSCAAIGASVFGITTKSIFDSPFLEMARKVNIPSFWFDLKLFLWIVAPTLFRLCRMKVFAEHEEFFVKAVKQIIEQRKKEGGKHADFIDLCLNLQNKEELKDEESGFVIKPTDEVMAAQAFFFFVAGVEPNASALFFTLLELGRNPEALERVHKEIDVHFEKYQNNLTYDNLTELKYLNVVLQESLRLHPPIGFISRQCVRDSVLPVGNIKVENGTKIFISVYGFQRDRKLYPDPEKFIPERFTQETKHANDTILAFGKGNRICFGERYAIIQILTGLTHLLRHFIVKSHVKGEKLNYMKTQFQIRCSNADVEFVPRKLKGY